MLQIIPHSLLELPQYKLSRAGLALLPANSGYIHPDEHFQSVEVKWDYVTVGIEWQSEIMIELQYDSVTV